VPEAGFPALVPEAGFPALVPGWFPLLFTGPVGERECGLRPAPPALPEPDAAVGLNVTVMLSVPPVPLALSVTCTVTG
jgi:hypothetical protein